MLLRTLVIFAQIMLLLMAGSSLAIEHSLGGSVELRYAEHTADEDGSEVLDASHFVQQYSLLWEGAGQLSGGRAGVYDLALGYQWNDVDTEINGSTVDIDNPLDKILFNGDLLLAPGGLPFRLHVYSYDLNSPSLGYQQLGELFRDEDYDEQRGIITSVQNGSNVTTGMTLMAGVKNGNYKGIYRDLLNAMPRLFIDFQQTDVKDVRVPTPLHYTDRDLAFVSLNKNKNWFHYRFFTHDDKVDSRNDYEEQSFLIGTIDHVNRRQWVDLTNWIQMSTDISYSETTPSESATEAYQNRYDYNLFTTAQRSQWSGGAYTSFSRVKDRNSLSKQLEVPIVAKGRLNRDTTWRFRLESATEESESFLTGSNASEKNLFLASRLEMFTQARYIVSPVLEYEYKNADRVLGNATSDNGNALMLGVEAYSNPRYRTDADLFGSYTLLLIEGNAENGDDVDYWEQQFSGKFAKDLNARLRTTVEQTLVWGTGTYNGSTTDYIQASVDAVASDSGSANGTVDGDYFRSISSWSLDHRPASKYYNRMELKYDFIDSPVTSGGQLSILHNFNYYGRSIRASIDNELIFGSALLDIDREGVDLFGGSSGVRGGGIVENSFQSYARVDYTPGRNHRNTLSAEFEWRDLENGGSDHRYQIDQLYEYAFWKNQGLLRKLAVVGEEFEYEKYSQTISPSSSMYSFTLFSEIYPTRQTLLGVRLRYEVDTTENTDAMLVFLSAGIDFEKFQMAFDYAYGTRTSGTNEPERVEHKWEVKVKKTF